MARIGDDFYTVKEAMALLGVSRTTMYGYVSGWRKRGGGPVVKAFSRRNIKFPKRSFRRWAGLED